MLYLFLPDHVRLPGQRGNRAHVRDLIVVTGLVLVTHRGRGLGGIEPEGQGAVIAVCSAHQTTRRGVHAVLHFGGHGGVNGSHIASSQVVNVVEAEVLTAARTGFVHIFMVTYLVLVAVLAGVVPVEAGPLVDLVAIVLAVVALVVAPATQVVSVRVLVGGHGGVVLVVHETLVGQVGHVLHGGDLGSAVVPEPVAVAV